MSIAIGAGARHARLQRAGKFGAVGVFGLGINMSVQAILIEGARLNYLTAAVLATQVSSTVNFLVADNWVFDSAAAGGRRLRRYLSFLAMNNAALALRGPIMWMLTSWLGLHYALSNLLSLLVMTAIRFALADNVIWASQPADVPAPPETSLPAPLPVLAPADFWTSVAWTELEPAQDAKHAVRPRTTAVGDVGAEDWALWDADLESGGDSSSAFPDSAGPDISKRGQRLGMFMIVATGAFLRTWKLMALGYNSDEAVYASQAAAIAGDRSIAAFFPIFRAHPLLFQAILSVPYQFGTSDLVGRLASVAFGLATIVVVFCTARLLYGPRVGMVAAALVALMPYHVIVTRQVLLDGPMTFFATLSLYFMARFVTTRRLSWMLAAAGALGLTTLAKETYIILVGSAFMFFALSPDVRLRLKDAALASAVFFMVLLPYPITIVMAGKSETGKNYLSWQLFRRPNHGLTFYPVTLPGYIGHAVLIGAVIALVVTWGRRRSWRERLLLSWVLVPATFLEVWPVKGFHYLLAVSMPIAILGARGICEACDRLAMLVRRTRGGRESTVARRLVARAVPAVILLGVALSIAIPAWSDVQPATSESFLAGTGGVPGGREVGKWIETHVPEGAEFMTVGPSMANIVQYYGHRKAYGLSVSPNPLNRNPSYEPIVNPDRAIRTNNLQYVVWDSYSTKRSEFFGDKLIAYAERYHGRVVYTYSSNGRPVIVVYEVRP